LPPEDEHPGRIAPGGGFGGDQFGRQVVIELGELANPRFSWCFSVDLYRFGEPEYKLAPHIFRLSS
jgi:hypothetical protein